MERLKQIFSRWRKQPLLKRLWLLGAFALVLLIEGREYLHKGILEKERVLCAKRDLFPGIKLSVHDLTITLVDKEEKKSGSLLSENRIHQVLGREVLFPVPEGTPIRENHFDIKPHSTFSKKIPKGYRAYFVKTAHLLPLEPGDRVDILGSGKGSQSLQELLIEDRQVIGVKTGENFSETLIAVRPTEVAQLDEFQAIGQLKILLRNPKEEIISNPKRFRKKVNRRVTKIEVWEE